MCILNGQIIFQNSCLWTCFFSHLCGLTFVPITGEKEEYSTRDIVLCICRARNCRLCYILVFFLVLHEKIGTSFAFKDKKMKLKLGDLVNLA